MAKRTYRMGEHLVQCDRCGGTFYASQTTMDGYDKGLVVCRGPGTRDCYDPPHPQDYVRAREDTASVANARPRNWQEGTVYCTASGRSAYPGYAVAGCSIVALEPSF